MKDALLATVIEELEAVTDEMEEEEPVSSPSGFVLTKGDMEIWPLYDAIRCPTLVIRGANSDLLAKKTVLQMAERGPKAKFVEIPDVGHAPTLMHADQISIVRDFLLEGVQT